MQDRELGCKLTYWIYGINSIYYFMVPNNNLLMMKKDTNQFGKQGWAPARIKSLEGKQSSLPVRQVAEVLSSENIII